MFASLKKSSTFALGLSKEVLSPINLLVISFSVINYVVRVRVHARCVDAHFFCYTLSVHDDCRSLSLSKRNEVELPVAAELVEAPDN